MPYTKNNRIDKEKYVCYRQLKPCTSSWTYDDWHCSGCFWKGFGVQDVKMGDDILIQEYEELKRKLGCK